MFLWLKYRWLVALGIGVVGGVLLSGFWPQTPLYAVATDRIDTFGMATGLVDINSEVEAVYFLDFLTGDLKAYVLGKQAGTWTGFFQRNVAADLGVDPQKAKYMMVTGLTSLRRAGGTRYQWSASTCYVAEVSTGKVAAYSIPWSGTMYAAGQPQNGQLLQPGQPISFRAGLGPGGGIGPGALPGGPRRGREQ